MANRYFIDDEPALANRLDTFLDNLRRSFDQEPFCKNVLVLLLGGGYGRGEGGVYRGPEIGGAALYNDLEFYVVTAGFAAPKGLSPWCQKWSEQGHSETGIEVEFKVLPASALREGQPSMFFYDLLLGHRVIWGEEKFCESLPVHLRNAAAIPAVEATRLLFNRGSGLLFSWEILSGDAATVDSCFIERNHAKAKLALGDAVLALNGRYDWSCRTRHSRLEEALPLRPPDWSLLKTWHQSGVEFKLHPRHENPGVPVLKQRQDELTSVWGRTFLWAESTRLQRTWSNAMEYADEPERIFPETSAVKNAALRVRDRLRVGANLPRLFDYPRGALQRTLVLLLGSEPKDQQCWRRAGSLLGIFTGAAQGAVMNSYRQWWQRYN